MIYYIYHPPTNIDPDNSPSQFRKLLFQPATGRVLVGGCHHHAPSLVGLVWLVTTMAHHAQTMSHPAKG